MYQVLIEICENNRHGIIAMSSGAKSFNAGVHRRRSSVSLWLMTQYNSDVHRTHHSLTSLPVCICGQ